MSLFHGMKIHHQHHGNHIRDFWGHGEKGLEKGPRSGYFFWTPKLSTTTKFQGKKLMGSYWKLRGYDAVPNGTEASGMYPTNHYFGVRMFPERSHRVQIWDQFDKILARKSPSQPPFLGLSTPLFGQKNGGLRGPFSKCSKLVSFC